MRKSRINEENKDREVAHELHREINCLGITENAIIPKNIKENKENYKPRTLVDQTLELIDPTPSIYTLFVQFNSRFFWDVLRPVEVKWSNRMTSCAGVCTFHPRNRQCVISLSAPLLKLRPRKDLVETLLHEMIHGYLFLTNNNRDRDGHGPEFCKHMHRINKEAGTNITIYHSFHDEVKLYQQHWWRCTGPCQTRKPYFGVVRRAMNRAPGPSDFWWREHQQTCGGQFIKIKEPENAKAKNKKNNIATKSSLKDIPAKNTPPKETILNWFKKPDNFATSTPKRNDSPNLGGACSTGMKNVKTIDSGKKGTMGITKLGNTANNVHGWSKSSNLPTSEVPKTSTPKFTCSGTVGGSNTRKSNLLDKFVNINQERGTNKSNSSEKFVNTNHSRPNTVQSIDRKDFEITPKKITPNHQTNNLLSRCPVCNTSMTIEAVSNHIESCLSNKNKNDQTIDLLTPEKRNPSSWSATKKRKQTSNDVSSPTKMKQKKLEDTEPRKSVNCPVCQKNLDFIDINKHLDECLCEIENKVEGSIDLPSSSRFPVSTVDRLKNSVATSSTASNSTDDKKVDESVMEISSSSSDADTDVVFVPSPSSRTGNSPNEKTIESDGHKCLICNTLIPPNVSLNDHLEECIKEVFHDESSFTDEVAFDDAVENVTEMEDTYPCPVCMKLIHGSIMNVHLDSCLKYD